MSGLSQAAERNKAPIGEVLKTVLPDQGVVLEIASGTGQHIVHFAGLFPHLTWLPSESDPFRRLEIEKNTASHQSNCERPIALDVRDQPWPVKAVDFVYCANMIHISPPETTPALFRGASEVLQTNSRLFLYGPFFSRDEENVDSNKAFDAWLKSLDPSYGVRFLDDVEARAHENGFALEKKVSMPANNLSLVFIKKTEKPGES